MIFFIMSIIALSIMPGKIKNNNKTSNEKKCLCLFIVYFIFSSLLYSSLGINDSLNKIITAEKFPTINVTYLKIIISFILDIMSYVICLVLSCKFSTSCFSSKTFLPDFEFKKLQNKITIFIIIMSILSIIMSLVTLNIKTNIVEEQIKENFNSSFIGMNLKNEASLLSVYSKIFNMSEEDLSNVMSDLTNDTYITHEQINKFLETTIQYAKNLIIKVTVIEILIQIPITIILLVICRDLLKRFYLKRLQT